ncbi:hypothetical protein [Kitasatospora sp. CB01950]|uniref:hypothetical protein n=1 Tax=Kitasatospora sp. CB01950 TaxID=1703930 RepID=UPI001F525D72|nr:hypothetical protein [Kitasatospora sp. CB01950]
MTSLLRAHLDFTGKIVPINDPVALKEATGTNLSSRVTKLVGKAKAVAAKEQSELHGLVVHLDLDAVHDGHYDTVRTRLRSELTARCPAPLALALAAWETESWLLLFPDAFPRVHPGWTVPQQLRGKDTGLVRNPKEELQRRLGTPRYRESDSPAVMRAAVDHGHAPAKAVGTSRSYRDFLADLHGW